MKKGVIAEGSNVRPSSTGDIVIVDFESLVQSWVFIIYQATRQAHFGLNHFERAVLMIDMKIASIVVMLNAFVDFNGSIFTCLSFLLMILLVVSRE